MDEKFKLFNWKHTSWNLCEKDKPLGIEIVDEAANSNHKAEAQDSPQINSSNL